MTIAYFDCFSGISGDMTLGALIDAGADATRVDAAVEALALSDEVTIAIRREQRGHVGGTRVAVSARERTRRNVRELRAKIDAAQLPDQVRRPAQAALALLAAAEGRVHDRDPDDAHLHQLGGADTLIDLVGAFWLLDSLGVSQVYASPLPAPRGRAGNMPLPAPASLRVLAGTGAVFEATAETKELVTPTGAAILAVSAKFERPALELKSIGYGIGERETPGNALAVWIGEEISIETGVTVIETNVDDMAPNLVAALAEDLMGAGALDVTVTPALMKKGRPGHVIAVMSSPDQVARLTDHLLRRSTTLGVRISPVRRVIAGRRVIQVETPLGTAGVKVKELGGRPLDVTPEYEDCRRIARERALDLREVMRVVTEAARRELGLS
ncbi:MAG TPA: nickel pincer cofactor biosynthesis protein LarC [Candidatus Dormibacteraeota bacterium]|nr:nickel pincer cofactor biosynthesis protein LarC [Candidatus Dormibacteraeota bacterium]